MLTTFLSILLFDTIWIRAFFSASSLCLIPIISMCGYRVLIKITYLLIYLLKFHANKARFSVIRSTIRSLTSALVLRMRPWTLTYDLGLVTNVTHSNWTKLNWTELYKKKASHGLPRKGAQRQFGDDERIVAVEIASFAVNKHFNSSESLTPHQPAIGRVNHREHALRSCHFCRGISPTNMVKLQSKLQIKYRTGFSWREAWASPANNKTE